MGKVWTEEETNLFMEMYPFYTNEYLLETVFKGRTRSALINMSTKTGVRKDYETLSHPAKKEALDNLKAFYIKNGYTPVCTDLVLLGLPSEASYRRYFGSYRKACLYLEIDVNISLFGKSIASISSNNDICLSKAELFVTEFLISKNIFYTKETKYSEITGDAIRCGLKRCDWYFPKFNVIVEYFGLPEKRSYRARMEEKRLICSDFSIDLVEVYRRDLKESTLLTIFEKYISN